MKKLFSIKESGYNYVICFLGIKLKIRSLKLVLKDLYRLKGGHQSLSMRNLLIYANRQSFTSEQKIWHLSQLFYENCGYYPNFKNPTTFNEKINWLKFNYSDSTMSRAVDKYEFKNYVKEQLGDGYTIPLIGVYEDVNDIDFDKLPNQFVIKTTTGGSGDGVEIVKDKKKFNVDSFKYRFSNLIQNWNSLYYSCLVTPMKQIKSKIIVEEYLEQKGGLSDYKFYCYYGEPKLVLGIKERKKGEYKFSFMSPEWEKLELHRGKTSSVTDIEKPKNYEKMLEIVKKLSKPFPFVRVDLYEADGKVYVGELTFYPKGGLGKYEPKEWDYKLGEWLDLKRLKPENVNLAEGFEGSEIGQYFIEKSCE